MRGIRDRSGIPLGVFTFDPLGDERLHDVRGTAAPWEGGWARGVQVTSPSLEDLGTGGGRGLVALGGVAQPRGSGSQRDRRVLKVWQLGEDEGRGVRLVEG